MFLVTSYRRKRLKSRPFPREWLSVLEQHVPLYRRLGEEDRSELQGHIAVFIAEKNFEGRDGLSMTDEIRVTIAAQACILLLHRQTDYYPLLSSIIVYQGEFLAPYRDVDDYGVVNEGNDLRSGETGSEGALVLSWEDAAVNDLDVHAGYNVVLHEFSHQLDAEDGITASDVSKRQPRMALRTLEREYHRLQRDAAHGRATVLDPYGAESLAEFFAVATESFFERPRHLKEHHPELYGDLARYYRQDPVSWPVPGP